ncbi:MULTISPECIES: hypothetical protein [Streptomyces]
MSNKTRLWCGWSLCRFAQVEWELKVDGPVSQALTGTTITLSASLA